MWILPSFDGHFSVRHLGCKFDLEIGIVDPCLNRRTLIISVATKVTIIKFVKYYSYENSATFSFAGILFCQSDPRHVTILAEDTRSNYTRVSSKRMNWAFPVFDYVTGMHCLGAVSGGGESTSSGGLSSRGAVMSVVRALGVLVCEGRLQGPPRGYKEGPHCAAPLQTLANDHVCEKDNYLVSYYHFVQLNPSQSRKKQG